VGERGAGEPSKGSGTSNGLEARVTSVSRADRLAATDAQAHPSWWRALESVRRSWSRLPPCRGKGHGISERELCPTSLRPTPSLPYVRPRGAIPWQRLSRVVLSRWRRRQRMIRRRPCSPGSFAQADLNTGWRPDRPIGCLLDDARGGAPRFTTTASYCSGIKERYNLRPQLTHRRLGSSTQSAERE
jgi:hypothetical protein